MKKKVRKKNIKIAKGRIVNGTKNKSTTYKQRLIKKIIDPKRVIVRRKNYNRHNWKE
ncbi:hypothetical protein MA16_Dca019547 [Dendrobium catenatum]|uniref:Uncharacterized protein n=1 Tax=Dendrobium catenatum TaxID=906689 RepID=A0A2I0XAI4_9ASPA|nr:hypothetical protein MA16_Dca019547 [Dendrobium catenatum]